MEEEIGQPFVFRGRWRGRKLWILVCASVLAAVVALILLVWAIPSSDAGEEKAILAGQESAQPEATEETTGEQPPEDTVQTGGEAPVITPGTGGEQPGLVVDFPDPMGGAPETQPPGGYKDIYGRWVLDMTGSAYGLTNCHIVLEEGGTISTPPDYAQVFEIVASQYRWEEASPSFTASLQLIVKMSSGQVMIPVQVELTGTVSGSLVEISGDFIATPQGEAFALYTQQGAFRMYR
jgi:nitrogen fixation-related uncharacterized protein